MEDVPGKMPDPQLVTFTTVTKEIIQSALQTPDGVTIEILYVQVMEQEFYVTEKDDADRRKLKKKGLLEISMEVAAAITPGDFDGFPRMLQELILDSTTDTQIDTALQKNEQFFDFEPLSVSSQSDEDAADKKRFSNGAMIGLATSCVVGVGLFFYQARRTNRRVTTRRIKAASFTDESDEEENHHRKAQNDDSSSHGDDPSGAFGGKSSYVPKDWDSYVPKEWDSSSPQSTGGETKFVSDHRFCDGKQVFDSIINPILLRLCVRLPFQPMPFSMEIPTLVTRAPPCLPRQKKFCAQQTMPWHLICPF